MRRTLTLPPAATLPLLLIPLILILVAGQFRGDRDSGQLANVLPPPEADYYLREAVVSTMDENGRLLHRVTAADVLHYPDQSVRLDQVRVDYLDGPWGLVARSGYMPPDQESLELTGDVDMHGFLRSRDEVQVQTDSVTIRFAERRIESAAPVTMRSGQITATAVGLRTDLDGQELHLLSEVRVDYAP